jgi:hypothetical protein
LVTNLGFMDMALKESSSHLSGRRHIDHDPQKQVRTMSKQCWFNWFLDLFFWHCIHCAYGIWFSRTECDVLRQ